MKALYIDFHDRNGVFRCSVPATPPENTIPAGVVIGKGWTVSTRMREVEYGVWYADGLGQCDREPTAVFNTAEEAVKRAAELDGTLEAYEVAPGVERRASYFVSPV